MYDEPSRLVPLSKAYSGDMRPFRFPRLGPGTSRHLVSFLLLVRLRTAHHSACIPKTPSIAFCLHISAPTRHILSFNSISARQSTQLHDRPRDGAAEVRLRATSSSNRKPPLSATPIDTLLGTLGAYGGHPARHERCGGRRKHLASTLIKLSCSPTPGPWRCTSRRTSAVLSG